jgi:hypothetical protein
MMFALPGKHLLGFKTHLLSRVSKTNEIVYRCQAVPGRLGATVTIQWFTSQLMAFSLSLFGLDTGTSSVLLLAICWGAGIAIAMVVLLVICITKRCRQARQERAMPPCQPTDKLIPPIYFTEEMQDPLRQNDLSERVAQPP